MKYTHCSNNKNLARVSSYRGTVTNRNDADIDILREEVKRLNQTTHSRKFGANYEFEEKWKYVLRFRARGPRRACHSGKLTCLVKDATHFDVYINKKYLN